MTFKKRIGILMKDTFRRHNTIMENIIMIKGKVNYTITLDPGVWIFDDRKVDLNTYFQKPQLEKNELEEYTKEISSHWDREITEGAIVPPTIKTEKRYEKEKLLLGSFGIPFKPFLLNASPHEDASQLIVVTRDEELVFDLTTSYNFILGFSHNGKPLKEDGPIHLYFGDGSNKMEPIKHVKEFIVS
jgi:hypothetical protein